MSPDQIRAQHTYRSVTGRDAYVQEITGQKVTYSIVGDVARAEASLRRFAARMDKEIPNQ